MSHENVQQKNVLCAEPCARICSSAEKRECLSTHTHMYNRNVQQNPLCAASCVTKDLHISPRFSPTNFYRDANPVLIRAHVCTTEASMRKNPEFDIVHEESVEVFSVIVKNRIGSVSVFLCSSCVGTKKGFVPSEHYVFDVIIL